MTDYSESIRFTAPGDSTIPETLQNFGLYSSFQNVLFVFDNSTDDDLSSYQFELYDESEIVNPLLAPYALKPAAVILEYGDVNASVFSIPVEGSTITLEGTEEPKNYFARVRAIDTSGNVGAWTEIQKTDQSTPLIDSTFIVDLTASRIKSGTIEAAEIVLGGANPAQTIIKSANFDGAYTSGATPSWSKGTNGWMIAANGEAVFGSASIRGNISAKSIYLGTYNRWGRNSADTADSNDFQVGDVNNYIYWNGSSLDVKGSINATSGTINNTLLVGTSASKIGISGTATASSTAIYSGTSSYGSGGFWLDASGRFSLGNKLTWDGSTLTVQGTLKFTDGSIPGTFDNGDALTAGSIGGVTINPTKIYAGTGNWANTNTAFYLDVNGYFSLKNKLYWDGTTLTINGNGSFSGDISAATGTFAGRIRGGDIYIGGADAASAPFKVDSAGNLTATSGTFSGALSGATGSIGEVSIGNNLIIGNNVRINGAAGDNSNSVIKVRADAQGPGNPTNSGQYPLNVVSNLNNTCLRVRYDARVDIGESGGVTSTLYIDGTLYTSSDVRLKSNVTPTNLGLNFINELRPVSYNLINEEITRNHYGFIAQEVKKVLEDLNADFGGWYLDDEENKESTQVLSYLEFVAPLVKAVQELSTKVDQLESRMI